MAKKTTSPKAPAPSPKRTPDTTNKNVDVSKLLELSREIAGLESETDILKEEIESLQDQLDIDNSELDKLDKRKSEYKTLKNNIILAVESIKIKREQLNKKNLLLRKSKITMSEIANVSASKNIPKEANPEDVERITAKNKQIENQPKIKKLAEDFDDDAKRAQFTDEEKNLVNTEAFRIELKKIRQEKQKIESIRRKIAQKEVEGSNLDIDEQIEKDLLLFNAGEREKIEALKDEIKNPKEEADKAKALVLTKRLLAHDTTLTEEEKKLEEKYNKDSLKLIEEEDKEKESIEKNLEKISNLLYVKDEDKLPIDEQLFDSTGALNIEVLKKRITSNEDKLFVARNSGKIDEIILKVKEQKDKEVKAKQEAAEKEANKQRDAFNALKPEQRAEKRAMAMERYQKIIDNKIKAIEDTHGKGTTKAEEEIAKLRNSALEKRNGGFSEDEKYHGSNDRKMARYNHNSEALRNILNNEQYKKLQKMDPAKMNFDQKKALEVFEKQKEDVKNNLKKIGPSGMDFVNLEEARAKLAKSSQEYSHSFKSKFFGSKILAGVSNMFGFKWSGIKEGEHTEHAKHEMHHAQEHYDKIRQQLMQNFVGEEHAVRKAWKQENIDISNGMEGLLQNVKRSFVDREYEKLDDLKHILEDSVKKPAFEKFAKLYKNTYWNWIKNERVRTVAKRLTNALFLGAVFAPFSLAAAGTVISTKLVRAAISGVAGETAAAGVAGIFGGKKNAKGEFVRFADKRDIEFKKHEDEFVRVMLEQIRANEKPNINQEIMNKLKTNHEEAMHQMQRRENRVRKGEMWARILVGGGTLYGLSQLDPDHVIIPGPNPEPVVVPNPNEINIEGNSVLANSKGFIQTFMDLKEKVVSEYANNPDYPQFKGLTHAQIADELGRTGQFDELTKEIMNAKSLDDFMNLAKDHGFWKPEGWNNSLIDSGSVPAGSRVGMEMADGNMRLYIELPNGTHIPIDDKFNEALEKSLKGVTMIDSDHLGNRAANLNSNGLENNPTTNNPELLNNQYPDLDDFEEGPQLTPAPTEDEVNDALRDIKSPEQIIDQGGSINDVKSGLEEIYQNRFNAVHGDYFKSHPMDLTSERSIYESLTRNGHDVFVEGDQETPMQTGDAAKIKFDRATAFIVDGEKYYLDSYTNLEDGDKILQKDLILAVDQDSKPITIQDYKEYQKLDHHKMVDEPYERYVRAQADASTTISQVSDNGADQSGASGPSVEDLRIQEEILLQKAGDAKYENWIDQVFGRDRIFGGHVNGVDTNAWDRIKNDKIEDFLNDTKNPDEVYRSAKEEDFFDTIREEVIKAKNAGYSVGIQKDETVAHFVDRLADISAKIDGVKRVASSR